MRICEVMQSRGLEVVVASAAEMCDPGSFDACVVGAGVYMGSWVKDGTEYLERFAPLLAERPVWLFSSGPLPGSTKAVPTATDPIELALGPHEGPGSGGRRKVEALAGRIHPREHRVFAGAFDPTDPPKGMAERLVRKLPMAKGVLPTGDFRDWPAIEAWAREIIGALTPVGAPG
jgi:menaquinone-dependent protoporphyrinogen oxidase